MVYIVHERDHQRSHPEQADIDQAVTAKTVSAQAEYHEDRSAVDTDLFNPALIDKFFGEPSFLGIAVFHHPTSHLSKRG